MDGLILTCTLTDIRKESVDTIMVVCIYDVGDPLLGFSPAELFNGPYLYTSSVAFSPFMTVTYEIHGGYCSDILNE